MQEVFAAKQLLMGGPFLDIQSGLGILDVEGEAQAREIVAHVPQCWRGCLNLTCIPGMPTSISIKLAALNQEADSKEPTGEKLGGDQRKSNRPRMHKKIETEQ
jgi:hypothetical protein